MKNIKYLLLFSFLSLQLTATQNEIIPCYNLEKFKSKALKLTPNGLVIFDIGNVIIRRTDNFFNKGKMNPALKQEIFAEHNKFLAAKGIKKELTANEKVNLWSTLKNSAATKLFSPETINIINDLQNKNIKCIAHTKMDVGTGSLKEKLEDYRLNILSNLNINFNKSFEVERLELKDSTAPASKPIFKKGVLFADKSTKGNSLNLLLKKLNFHPKKIIMIDDQIHYLESVAKTAKDLNIDFIGIEYLAIQSYRQDEDKKLNLFQLNHYFETNQWLIDEEAKKILNHT